MKEICPKCGDYIKLTRHHIFPRRNFGRGKHNCQYLYICRDCHDKLELLIPYKRQHKKFYTQVVKDFMEGSYVVCDIE